MTIGERIKSLRTEKGFSQEKLAEELHVSRSAVAKWEADGGIPELDNLLQLSSLFDVSIDELVGNARNQKHNQQSTKRKGRSHEFGADRYDIEVSGIWNDGIYGVYMIGEDSDFLYYDQFLRNAKSICGMVNKKYITSVSKVKEKEGDRPDAVEGNRDYFIGKPVAIKLAKKEGLIKGFFDFRDDDYQNVVIQSFESKKLYLEYGKSIDIDDIINIEEV